jgi:hypothetical protein
LQFGFDLSMVEDKSHRILRIQMIWHLKALACLPCKPAQRAKAFAKHAGPQADLVF